METTEAITGETGDLFGDRSAANVASQHAIVHDRRRLERETITIVLRPEPGVDGIAALRAALKVLLRRFGLKAISVV